MCIQTPINPEAEIKSKYILFSSGNSMSAASKYKAKQNKFCCTSRADLFNLQFTLPRKLGGQSKKNSYLIEKFSLLKKPAWLAGQRGPAHINLPSIPYMLL